MSVILNEVRRAAYLDSIVLMRISRVVAALPGVEEALVAFAQTMGVAGASSATRSAARPISTRSC